MSLPNLFANSRFLTKDDVGYDGIIVTISHLTVENVARQNEPVEMCPVMHFLEDCKPMVLKPVNANLVAAATGIKDQAAIEAGAWANHQIILFHDPSVMMAGKAVGGIRVRGMNQPQPQPQQFRQPPQQQFHQQPQQQFHQPQHQQPPQQQFRQPPQQQPQQQFRVPAPQAQPQQFRPAPPSMPPHSSQAEFDQAKQQRTMRGGPVPPPPPARTGVMFDAPVDPIDGPAQSWSGGSDNDGAIN